MSSKPFIAPTGVVTGDNSAGPRAPETSTVGASAAVEIYNYDATKSRSALIGFEFESAGASTSFVAGIADVSHYGGDTSASIHSQQVFGLDPSLTLSTSIAPPGPGVPVNQNLTGSLGWSFYNLTEANGYTIVLSQFTRQWWTNNSGASWTRSTSPGDYQSQYVIGYGAGKYIMPQPNTALFYKTSSAPVSVPTAASDTAGWTTLTGTYRAAHASARAIAYGQNLFVIATAGDGIHSSTDGLTWTTRLAGIWGTAVYANNKFVVGGRDSANTPALASSTDGISWTTYASPNGTPVYSPNGAQNTFQYLNNKYLLGVEGPTGANWGIHSSTDAITWVTATLTGGADAFGGQPSGFAYSNGIYFASVSGGDTVVTSTDAVTWVTNPQLGTATSNIVSMRSFVGGTGKPVFTKSDGAYVLDVLDESVSVTLNIGANAADVLPATMKVSPIYLTTI